MKRWRLAILSLCAVATAAVAALCVAVWREPMPAALTDGPPSSGLVVEDRHGQTLSELPDPGRARSMPTRADRVAPELVWALLAAEDARFYSHFGVDPWAMLRAGGQWIWHGRPVSGASTLTQQLARKVIDRPRTLSGKLREIVVALRIERELQKSEILEEYLNRVDFGPNLRGVTAASRAYFDKPPSKLSLAEAATLAALPRGPSLYDLDRYPARAKRRRDRILERLRNDPPEGLSTSAIDQALTVPVALQRPAQAGGAEHLIRALARRSLEPELGKPGSLARIRTTLDLGLQREAETLVRSAIRRLASHDASAAAVLVIDNASAEVLAYVGSPDFLDEAALGQNDGVRARRQPGSALKPFVYATAIEQLGWTAATLLPDIELRIPEGQGRYSPQNYDGRFHGPVRLREALAGSLNVPAVYAAHRTGPARVLEQLHRLGFASLDRPAVHYGSAIALGDGEVTLGELAAAYATLARGGIYLPLRFFVEAERTDGSKVRIADDAPRTRALEATTAALITDVLADNQARRGSFGRGNALELPFPVAAKTGTSKRYRDNWTVGYTSEVTVAVWVGNFDGRPMRHSSGVTGAAPLFHSVMLAAMRGRPEHELTWRTVTREICTLSGQPASHDCPHRLLERFALDSAAETRRCEMHVRSYVHPLDGGRATARCPGAIVGLFEHYPPEYALWAEQAGRPTLPEHASIRCALAHSALKSIRPRIGFPTDGSRFAIDPAIADTQQRLSLTAEGSGPIELVLNGRSLGTGPAPLRKLWPLIPGEHRVFARSPRGGVSDEVRFSVH